VILVLIFLEEELIDKNFRHDKIFMLVLCFKNIIEIIQSEIFLSLKQILEISIRILSDNNDVVNSKSTEIESLIKNKICIYFDTEKNNDQGGFSWVF
jgi:hypothetical protein